MLRDGTGAPATLIGVPSWRVSMVIDDRHRIFHKIAADATVGEDAVTLPEDQMIHVRFRNVGSTRHWGIPPAASCSPSFGSALVSRDVQRILFQNISRPGGVLSAPGKVAKEVAKEIQAQWDQNFAGSSAGKVAVISNGLTYSNILWNAAELNCSTPSKRRQTTLRTLTESRPTSSARRRI